MSINRWMDKEDVECVLIQWNTVISSLSSVWFLCNIIDYSPPGSFVHRIFWARILGWVAISYSRDLPDLGIKPASPTLAGRFFTTEPRGKPTMEYYSAIKKNEIISFAATWIDTQIIILSKGNQAEKGKYHDIFYMWSLKINDTNELIYETDLQTIENKPMVTKGKGRGGYKLGGCN